jgi:hypothetical protein
MLTLVANVEREKQRTKGAGGESGFLMLEERQPISDDNSRFGVGMNK